MRMRVIGDRGVRRREERERCSSQDKSAGLYSMFYVHLVV